MNNDELLLEAGIRQAITDYMGDPVSGPWDSLITLLTDIIARGNLGLEQAARLSLLLDRTQGGIVPDECRTCGCDRPGLSHEIARYG